jgi:hypothetical protein
MGEPGTVASSLCRSDGVQHRLPSYTIGSSGWNAPARWLDSWTGIGVVLTVPGVTWDPAAMTYVAPS